MRSHSILGGFYRFFGKLGSGNGLSLFFLVCASFCFSTPGQATIESLGSLGGSIQDLVIYPAPSGRTYAYIAQGIHLIIVDVSDQDRARVVDKVAFSTSAIRHLSLSQNRLAVSNDVYGVKILSLENPEKPALLQTVSSNVSEAWLGGNLLHTKQFPSFACGGSSRELGSLVVYDISTTNRPTVLSTLTYYASNLFSFPKYFWVDETNPETPYFYRTAPHPGISDFGKNPFDRVLYGNPNTGYLLGIVVKEPTAFITYTQALVSYTSNASGDLIGSATLYQGEVKSASILDRSDLYLPLQNQWLRFDVSFGPEPTLVETLNLPFTPKTIVNGVAFGVEENVGVLSSPVAGADRGKVSIVFSSGFTVEQVKRSSSLLISHSLQYRSNPTGYDHTYRLLRIREDRQFDVVYQFDISNPEPSVSGYGDYDHFWMEGNLAAIATGEGIQLFDLTDPAQPKKAALLPHMHHEYGSDTAEKLFTLLDRGYFHINDFDWKTGQGGWYIYSVHDPYRPELVKHLPFDENIRSSDNGFVNHIYYFLIYRNLVGGRRADIGVYDFTDPLHPTSKGTFEGPNGISHSMSVDQDKMVIADNTSYLGRLYFFNLKDPIRPVKVEKHFEIQDVVPEFVWLSGSHLWLLSTQDVMGCSVGHRYLQVYNVEDMQKPVLLDSQRLSRFNTYSTRSLIWDNSLFLATGDLGLHVLEYQAETGLRNWDWHHAD